MSVRSVERGRRAPAGALLCLAGVCALACVTEGCATVSVDTIRLTRDRFPARPVEQVDLLPRRGGRAYREVAELHARGESTSFERLQDALLKQAAALGADAIIVQGSATHLKEGVAYQPMSPWGYDPYYGPDPWDAGYGGAYGGAYMAVPYQVDVRSLKATAVIYDDLSPHTR